MLGLFSIIIGISTIALLVAGLIISKKYAFLAGVYFFLILIINEVYLIIDGPIMRYYIDSVVVNNGAPFGLTIGEYVTWLSFIPRTLELIAFIFLVIGLYKLWKLNYRVGKIKDDGF